MASKPNDTLDRWVGDILKQYDEIASLKGEHARCVQERKEVIDETYERAKADGFSKKALKKTIAIIIKAKKLHDEIEDLDDDAGGQVREYAQRLVDKHPELQGLPLFEQESLDEIGGKI